MTEAALIGALKAGNPEAYDQLYQQYWKTLYKKVYSRVLDEETAKDIVQEVFISVWQRRDGLSISTTLEQFLFGAVRLQVFNHFRSQRVKQRVLDQALLQLGRLEPEQADLVSRHTMESALDEALHDMPENMKQSFLLRCENLSIREIALRIGLAEQTVSNNLSEAVRRLRAKMAHHHRGTFVTCASLFLTLINH